MTSEASATLDRATPAAQIDRFPVKDLPGRYNLKRTQEYERRKALGIEPTKDGSSYYVSADDLLRLDELDRHIKSGGTLANFGTFGEQNKPHQTREPVSLSPVVSLFSEQSELMQLLFRLMAAASKSLPAAQPLVNLEAIERAYQHQWLLSTSQLCELLGVRSIQGQTIDRYGFRFTRCGRNGREGAWRIEKISL